MNCPYCNNPCVISTVISTLYKCEICFGSPRFFEWSDALNNSIIMESGFQVFFSVQAEESKKIDRYYYFPQNSQLYFSSLEQFYTLPELLTPSNLEQIIARINNLKVFL